MTYTHAWTTAEQHQAEKETERNITKGDKERAHSMRRMKTARGLLDDWLIRRWDSNDVGDMVLFDLIDILLVGLPAVNRNVVGV